MLSSRTTQLFVSLESSHDLVSFINTNMQNLPPMIGVKLSMGTYQSFSRGTDVYFNDSHLKIIEAFRELRLLSPNNVNLIPEIDFSEEYIQVGPTIFQLFEEFQLPFLFISVMGSPSKKKVMEIQKIFEYLYLRGLKKKIYFSFSNLFLEEWNIKTFNTFSGMQMLHLDLSNKCTHSCTFCGVWGPDFIAKVKEDAGGKIPPASVDFMNKQLSTEMANKILSELPETVKVVQFGGVGDPLTHPNWLEIVSGFRQKGIRVEILTNLDCISLDQLDILHALSQPQYSMHISVNISAGNRNTYSIVRPRQGVQVFDHILKNINYLTNLKKKDAVGVDLTLLHVINKYNFQDMCEMVTMGHHYSARVWLKPLEVHSELHQKFEIPVTDLKLYSETLQKAIALAKDLNVELIHDFNSYSKGVQLE